MVTGADGGGGDFGLENNDPIIISYADSDDMDVIKAVAGDGCTGEAMLGEEVVTIMQHCSE